MLTGTPPRRATSPTNQLSPQRKSAVEAIVLAGSYSWRRTPFDAMLPRPLLPVAQVPVIGYPLQWAAASGTRRITICANGLAPLICQHLHPYRGSLPPIDFANDAPPRGAAGAARDSALATRADLFVVADATTIPEVNLARVLEEHCRRRAALTIIVQPSPRAAHQAERHLVPTGLYIFSRRAFDAVPAGGYQDIKESLIPRLYAAGELVTTSEADGTCPHVLDAQTYLSVNHWMITHVVAQRASMRPLGNGHTIVHPSARISPAALLIGPVLVDAGAEVEAGATIVGPVAIGARSIVAAGALVSRSVVWPRCSIGGGAIVDRTVLASDVDVAAGTRLVSTIRTATTDRSRRVDRRIAHQPLPEIQPALPARGLAVH